MKTLFKFIFGLACLGLLCLVIAPFVLSQEWGKNAFLRSVNYFSKNSLTIDKLSLSWTHGQHIEGIQWKDPRKETSFSCTQITTDAPLTKILFAHDMGEMVVQSPQLTLSASKTVKQSTLQPVGFVNTTPPLADSLNTPTLAYHPLFRPQFNWIKYQGSLTLKQGEMLFLYPNAHNLKFENLDLQLKREQKDALHIEANCQITEKDVVGTFNMTGAITHIETPDQDISIQSKLLNFPIRSIDQIAALFEPHLEGFFIDLIGESLSADLKLVSSAKELSLDIDANSSQFSAYARTEAESGTISLHSPALFTWNLTPTVLKKLTGVETAHDVTALVKINKLTLPLADQKAFSFQAELRTSEVQNPSFTIDPMVISVSTENFHEKTFKASLSSPQVSCEEALFSWNKDFKLLKPATLSGSLAGTIEKLSIPSDLENLAIQADLTVTLPQMTEPLQTVVQCSSIQEISLIFKNKHFATSILGKLNRKDQTFVIKNPTELTYHLDKSNIYAIIDPCAIPLTLAEIKKLKLSGTGHADTIVIKEHSVKDLNFSFQGQGSRETLHVQASGSIDNAPFDCDIETHQWLPKTVVHVKAKATDLSASFIASYLPKESPFIDILGETLTFEVEASSSDSEQTLWVKTNSPHLKCDLSLKQEENTLKLVKPAHLSLELTGKAYAALAASQAFDMVDKAIIDCHFSELSLPITLGKNRIPSLVYDIRKAQLQGDVLIDKLSFTSQGSQESTTLNHLKVHLSQPSQKSPLAFQLSSSVGEQGILSIQGSFDHLTSALSLNGNVQQFPTKACEFLTASKFPLTTIFGDSINLTATAKIQDNSGPIKISLLSPHTRVSCDGVVTKGVLTLNDTIYAQMTLTQEISRLLLKDINPLSSSIVHAESPLTLEIPKEDVSIPLSSLKMANIPHAKIELGKILCENKGNLSSLLGILKSSSSKDKQLSTWFSPIALSLKDGVLTSDRTDILIADAYQICSWGTIDLMKDTVDLTLGLTSSCLKKAFHIKNLPEAYVLQIPMTGPTNDVQVDTGVATTKIAALLLWEQKAALGDRVGGSAGDLLGGFLNKIGPVPGADNKAPPAHHPLPWENTKGDLSSTAPEPGTDAIKTKKKHFKPHEKPIKQILKMVR